MAFSLPRCLTCSCSMAPWGRTANGKRRYRCCQCHTTKIRRTEKVDPFPGLFRQYVLWGATYETISSISGYSIQHLATVFHRLMLTAPPILLPLDQSVAKETFLLIDGLWFGRWFVLMVYRQSKTLRILHITVAGREVKSKIARDLRILQVDGYRFTGVVSDGGPGILGAVNLVFPHIPHQICLAHMHRAVIAGIGKHPIDWRVQELKALADHVWKVESCEALRWWESHVRTWVRDNLFFIHEKRRDNTGRWWYIHKGVRRAATILLQLPSTSFVFLTHPTMPKTTNELEAQFGHLGKRWLAHRGLKKERWERFLTWFVYFYNTDKMAVRKSKEDMKNNTES